ncbi:MULTISPECIES: DUF1302 domain-containing protein [Pseudomonas]|uniref:DUF1302 domain-containing protein n=1 Tax=Pseudomonas spirodelae TaxID=3101751 RepID=A0ABU5PDA6_9PSED|nr:MULTISPECIES: DUF1302 domain-containing protein [unclassified Pseudomonas]MDD2160281.1 DUF1302 domain-containing protein [Pseudomonas sp. MIL19]MEA1607589.1 DUF1302 domain-containing protein [Pseudomonas sp. T5W1]
MTKTKQTWRLARLPLAVSLASTLAAPAFGVTFNIGEIEGQIDSSMSVGASWSTQKADKDLIGVNNGGRGLSQTSDDGHLNFKRGETFSKIFKGIHDLELKYGDTGVFVRGKYWYDFELKDEGREFKDISDNNRKEGQKSSGAQILDAFVYHNYSIADQPGSVRLGKQVVSWGESTFIQNGINSINPVDVSAFRRPGAEIKEGLIPVNMFYVAQSLTENLSMEAFYQLEWDQTVTDNCGTFFAQADIVADGCDQNLNVLASLSPAQLASINGNLKALNTALGTNAAMVSSTSEGLIVPRRGDVDARDSGQWGLAFRYMFEPLDTEFGAYAMNYHSRAPIFSGASPSAGATRAINTLVTGAANPSGNFNAAAVPAAANIGAVTMAANGGYFIEYPEDIKLYGLSFSTTLPTGTAWSGELSYRPNAPVQLNSTDILYAGLRGINVGILNAGNPVGSLSPYDAVSPLGPDSEGLLHGYKRKEITQLQTTFTHFFDQVMGASRLTLVGEVGWTHVGGLESSDDIRYGRDPIFGTAGAMCGPVNVSTAGGKSNGSLLGKSCDKDGFTTADSWGYRARAIWEYPDVFAGINLKPSVAWSHDVDGYSPGPGGNFEEGRKAVSLGLDAEYQNTYTASLSYTNFFDGKYSTVDDRDFVALSFGMNF